jgi:K(+)-stimulated pyrophosphate-energized sodium pump
MNILIKLMSIVSLVIAPTLAQIAARDTAAAKLPEEKKVVVSAVPKTTSSATTVAYK